MKDSDLIPADEFRVIYLVSHKFGLSFLPGCDLPVFNGIIIHTAPVARTLKNNLSQNFGG